MDKPDLLALYDRQMRMELRLPDLIYENTGSIIRDYSQDEGGYIDYAALDQSTADREIDAQVAFFQSLGLPFTWKVFDHDRPADLRQRLQARGFEIDQTDSLMVLDVHNAPEYYWSMDLPDIVTRVTDAAGVEQIVRMEEEVWQAARDGLRKRLLRLLEGSPHQISLFTVPVEGRVVSAAWTVYYHPTQFASLLGGSTLAAYRNRGYYTALLVTRAREARERGSRFLVVDASTMSAPILEKHGFQRLDFSTRCRWSPEA